MQIAVASGKGGTGKTLVAVNLAQVIPDSVFVDCDTEEPNGHIFLQPTLKQTTPVAIPIPTINENLCTLCGKCMEVCQYNAIIIGKTALVFQELCHGCGSCYFQCPEKAISEIPRIIGEISSGTWANGEFYQGTLNVGEPMSPPIIKKIKTLLPKNKHIILDSPPGTSCPMVATVSNADYVILVTEPTPFGLHDLALAIDTLKKIHVDFFGVVINKSGPKDDLIENYCQRNNIEILKKIPHSLDIAKLYATGEILATNPKYQPYFTDIYKKITWELA